MSFIQTIPPPNPKGLVGMVGAVVLVVGLLFAVAWCGCAPASEPKLPAYCYSQSKFGDELQDCVKRAKVVEESRACRAEVHRRCGIVMTSSATAVDQ